MLPNETPLWPLFEAVAPTLAYAVAVLGDESEVPLERARQVTTWTLLMAGGAESPYRQAMHTTVTALAASLPNSETRILDGQTHYVDAATLAPVLTAYFGKA